MLQSKTKTEGKWRGKTDDGCLPALALFIAEPSRHYNWIEDTET